MSRMSESVQQAAIRRNFSTLVVGISSQVRSVADRAYERGLIGVELLRAGEHDIVSAINNRVTSDRDRKPFDDFVTILEEEPSTVHLAEQLRKSENEAAAELETTASQTRSCHLVASRTTSGGGLRTTPRKFDSRIGEDAVFLENPVTLSQPVQREKRASSSRTYMVAPEIATVQRLTLDKRQQKYMDMLQDQISRPSAAGCEIPSDPDSPGLTLVVDRPTLSSQSSSDSSGSSLLSSESNVMVVRGEGYRRYPTALKVEGFVGEETAEGRHLPEQESQCLHVDQLLKQFIDLREKRKQENSEAFRLYIKRRLLQKQIRHMDKDKTKLERKLKDVATNYEKLKGLSKKQAAEVASLFRKLKLTECELDEVSKEKNSLEERCMTLQTDLDCLKAKEEQYKVKVSDLQRMLKVAVQDACCYREENESLKARMNTLESLIDRFRNVKYVSWSSSTNESPVPVLHKSYSL